MSLALLLATTGFSQQEFCTWFHPLLYVGFWHWVTLPFCMLTDTLLRPILWTTAAPAAEKQAPLRSTWFWNALVATQCHTSTSTWRAAAVKTLNARGQRPMSCNEVNDKATTLNRIKTAISLTSKWRQKPPLALTETFLASLTTFELYFSQ